MVFIAYSFKGRWMFLHGERELLVTRLQDKCNIEIILSPVMIIFSFFLFTDNQEKTTMKPKVPPKKDNRPYKPFEPDTKKDKKPVVSTVVRIYHCFMPWHRICMSSS